MFNLLEHASVRAFSDNFSKYLLRLSDKRLGEHRFTGSVLLFQPRILTVHIKIFKILLNYIDLKLQKALY